MVSAQNLVKVSDRADEALGSFDFAAHGGHNAVRLFVQGFG